VRISSSSMHDIERKADERELLLRGLAMVACHVN